MTPITIGVVCIGRKTFDFAAAEAQYKATMAELNGLKDVKFVFAKEMVYELPDAEKAAREIAAHAADAAVVINGTFALGSLVLAVAQEVRKPLLLWGMSELPYNGGKIRLNSLCGVNLNASNLYKAGVRDFTVHIGNSINAEWLSAIRVIKAMSTARIGLAGFHAHTYYNLGVYELATFKQTGALIDHIELDDIFNVAVDEKAIAARRDQLKSTFDVSGVTATQVDKVATLTAKLDAFITEKGYTALALRCWPEFAKNFGISPCAAMSLLQSENKILACEGDIDGALSMLAHTAAGAQTPFLFDFSQINFQKQFALLWHCGVAPCNLWDKKSKRSLDTYFAGGKGVTADFVLKEGPVSYLRFDSAGEEYRVLLGRAKAVAMEQEIKGTYLKAVFTEDIKTVFERVVYNGFAHHASIVYGDFTNIFETVARIKGWKVFQ